MTQEHKTNTQVEKPPKKISVVISFELSLQDSRTADLEPMAYLTPDLVEKALSIAASFKDGGKVKGFAIGGDVSDDEPSATTSNTAASEDIGTSDVDRGPPSATTRAAASEDIGAIETELNNIKSRSSTEALAAEKDQGQGQGQGQGSSNFGNFGFNRYSDEDLERSKTELESRPLESQRVAGKLAALDKVLDERRKESAPEGPASLVEDIFDNLIDNPNRIEFYDPPPASLAAEATGAVAPPATPAAATGILAASLKPPGASNLDAEKEAVAKAKEQARAVPKPTPSGKKQDSSANNPGTGNNFFEKAFNQYNFMKDSFSKNFTPEGQKELSELALNNDPRIVGSNQTVRSIETRDGKVLGASILENIDGEYRVVHVYANGPESEDTPEMAAEYKELFETQDIQNSLDARGEGKDEREALGLASLAAEAKKPVEPIKPKTIQIPRFTARDFAAFSPTGMYSNKGIPGVLGETR